MWVVTAVASVHATFGRNHAMALCRKWATDDTGTDVAPLRLALEHPSSFLVVGEEQLGGAFVCTPVGRATHRIDATTVRTAERFRALRAWHETSFPEHELTVGTLPRAALAAWGTSTP